MDPQYQVMFVRLRAVFPGNIERFVFTSVYIPPASGGRLAADQPDLEEQPLPVTVVAPNPTANEAKLTFTLREEAETQIDLIDSRGNIVARHAEGFLPSGTHQRAYDHAALPTGTYLYRVQAGRQVAVQKLLVSR